MNKKNLFNLALAVVVSLGINYTAQAITLQHTFNSFVGGDFGPGLPSYPYYTVDTPYDFSSLIPAGERVKSATIHGTWGDDNPLYQNIPCTSAHNIVDLDGFVVAVYDSSVDPQGLAQLPWSYTFSPGSNLSIFNDGIVSLGTQQTSHYIVRMGVTTLTIETEPTPAPEPSSMILGLIGLGSALGIKRKKTA